MIRNRLRPATNPALVVYSALSLCPSARLARTLILTAANSRSTTRLWSNPVIALIACRPVVFLPRLNTRLSLTKSTHSCDLSQGVFPPRSRCSWEGLRFLASGYGRWVDACAWHPEFRHDGFFFIFLCDAFKWMQTSEIFSLGKKNNSCGWLASWYVNGDFFFFMPVLLYVSDLQRLLRFPLKC